MKVPLLDLRLQYERLRPEFEAAVAEVMASQALILGPKVAAFEEQIAEFVGVPHAVGASSGTDAQLLIYMALGLGCGDAVLTSPYTFFSTVGGLVRLGIEPVFADISPETFNITPQTARTALENSCVREKYGQLRTFRGNRLKAVMPVHLFGQCADEGFSDFAAENGLLLIEDAAQALGAEIPYKGGWQRAGALGDAAFFSFYPTKNLGAFGDAGMAVCKESAIAERMRAIRNHGMTRRYHHPIVGGNFRLDALQAAVLSVKLPHLDSWSNQRRKNALLYKQAFAEFGDAVVSLPVESRAADEKRHHHIYNQFVIRSPFRNALREALAQDDIGTEIYYPIPLHLQECFAGLGYKTGDFPEAERAAAETLALPIFPELLPEQIRFVARRISEFHARITMCNPGAREKMSLCDPGTSTKSMSSS